MNRQLNPTATEAIESVTKAANRGSALDNALSALRKQEPVEAPAPKVGAPATTRKTYYTPAPQPARKSGVISWADQLKAWGRSDLKAVTLSDNDKAILDAVVVTRAMDFEAWLKHCGKPRLILGLDPDYEWASKLFTGRREALFRGGN